MARSGGRPSLIGALNVTTIEWGKGVTLFRVHRAVYSPTQFNPSKAGDARFSPLILPTGEVVPTLYAGTTLDCALMETVFHDVPFAPGLKTVSKKTIVHGQMRSSMRAVRDLSLIDLRSIALRRLGLTRRELIKTEAAQYPVTRSYALRLYEQLPSAEGMIWTSRQDDQSQALVLFETRLEGFVLEQLKHSESLILADGSASSDVLALADRLGVLICLTERVRSFDEEVERLAVHLSQLQEFHYIDAPVPSLTLGQKRVGHPYTLADIPLTQAHFFSRFDQSRE